MNFFDILYARRNGDALSANFFDLLFAKATTFDVWEVYEGTLPAQFNANGDNLKNYKVWGNTGGVGKETVNVWSGVVEQGSYTIIDGQWSKQDSGSFPKTRCRSSDFISVKPSETYTIKAFSDNDDIWLLAHFLDSQQQKISETEWLSNENAIFQTPENCAYMDFICKKTSNTNVTPLYFGDVMLTEGSTAPESYIPYGYELDILTRKNLWTSNVTQGAISTSGNFSDSTTRVRSVIYNLTGGESYTVNCSQSLRIVYAYSYDGVTLTPVEMLLNYAATGKHDYTFTMPSGANAIGIGIQNNEGSSVAIVPSDVAYKSLTTGDPNTTTIYVGPDPLEKDEYIDSESGKVYRRTEQLWDGVWKQGQIDLFDGGIIDSPNFVHTNLIPHQFADKLAFKFFAFSEQGVIAFYDTNGDYMQAGSVAWHVGESIEPPDYVTWINTVPTGAAYARLSFSGETSEQPITPETAAQVIILDTNTEPSQQTAYIPYLQPTDPPVTLPQLPTIDGSTIIEVDSVVQPEKVYFEYKTR